MKGEGKKPTLAAAMSPVTKLKELWELSAVCEMLQGGFNLVLCFLHLIMILTFGVHGTSNVLVIIL